MAVTKIKPIKSTLDAAINDNGNTDLRKRYRRAAGVPFLQVPQEGAALL